MNRCACGLAKGRWDIVCGVCLEAAPPDIRFGAQSVNFRTRATAERELRQLAAKRAQEKLSAISHQP